MHKSCGDKGLWRDSVEAAKGVSVKAGGPHVADSGVRSSRPLSLDHKVLNGCELEDGEGPAIQGRACRCKSAFCRRCGVGYYGQVRARVEPHKRLFVNAMLLTLTIDPKRFASGESAFEYIEGNGYIRRLLRELGFKKGVKVLAFHSDKPSRPDGHNWPHWHVVVDENDLRDGKGWADYKGVLERANYLWKDKWGIGALDLPLGRRNRHKVRSAAFSYAISYCQRQAGVAADWILKRKRAPRAFEFIGELRKAISDYEKPLKGKGYGVCGSDDVNTEAADEDYSDKRKVRAKREGVSVEVRIQSCGKGCNVLERKGLGWSWCGYLVMSPSQLAMVLWYSGNDPELQGVSCRKVWISASVMELVVCFEGGFRSAQGWVDYLNSRWVREWGPLWEDFAQAGVSTVLCDDVDAWLGIEKENAE